MIPHKVAFDFSFPNTHDFH